MEHAVANKRSHLSRCHALVHIDGEPGRYVASVALRDGDRKTLYTASHALYVSSATEAALLAAAHAHAAAYDHRIRRLDVHIDDAAAVDVLSGRVPASDDLTKSYFRARTTARKLAQVRIYRLPENFAAGVRRLVRTGPVPQNGGSSETLSLFGQADVA